LRPDAERRAAEAAKFAELRSLIVGSEQRELVDLKAHLADRAARTQEISGVLPDAIAQSAGRPDLVRALGPAVEQAISASVRKDPGPMADALLPAIRRALRNSLREALAPLATLAWAAILVGGIWTFQAVRERDRWNSYLERLDAEPGIVVVQSGRRNGKFFVTGLRDELATDPATLVEASGLSAASVESRWEPYQAVEAAFVPERARRLLRPPAGVTLSYSDGVLTATGTAPAEWVNDSQRIAPVLAGVRNFQHVPNAPEQRQSERQRVEGLAVSERPRVEGPATDRSTDPSATSRSDVAAIKNSGDAGVKPDVAIRPRRGSPEQKLIEQIEASTLTFGEAQTQIAPGQDATVRRLSNLFGELNEIVHPHRVRARVEIVAYSPDTANPATKRLAMARADSARALFRSPQFDVLDFTPRTDSAIVSPRESGVERTRRVTFRVRLLNGSTP
jgi:hypothetical protein